MKRKINPTRIPIEEKESFRWIENLRQSTMLLDQPERCVHIGDRESDIYELFSRGEKLGTRFLVRTCVDRLAGDGVHTINAQMSEAKVIQHLRHAKARTQPRLLSAIREALASVSAQDACGFFRHASYICTICYNALVIEDRNFSALLTRRLIGNFLDRRLNLSS